MISSIQSELLQNIQDNDPGHVRCEGENSFSSPGDGTARSPAPASRYRRRCTPFPASRTSIVFKVKADSPVSSIQRSTAQRPRDQHHIGVSVNTAIFDHHDTSAHLGDPGDRRFNLTVRYPDRCASTPDAVRRILLRRRMLPAAFHFRRSGGHQHHEGSFMIYRESGSALHPHQDSACAARPRQHTSRLQSKLASAVRLLAHRVRLLLGEAKFDGLRKEQRRLASSSPSTLLDSLLLYIQFSSWVDTGVVPATFPPAAIGEVYRCSSPIRRSTHQPPSASR